jgi:hypothetical protein
MRSLLATIFGWKLVHLENSATEIVRRVRFNAEGEPYCVYFGSYLIWIAREGAGWKVSPLNFRRVELFG